MAESIAPNVLIVGATSGIARELAKAYARQGAALLLAGRDPAQIQQDARDLGIRHGIAPRVLAFDADDPDALMQQLSDTPVSAAVLCHGVLLDNDAAIADPRAYRTMIGVNYTSYALLMEGLAAKMQAQGGGVIAALSSVAGDRGRGSNYCYGATKAALTAYADGLRGRLVGSGVHVVTVKPGPVKTPMTAGMPGYEKMAEPSAVAEQIVRAVEKRQDIVYTPGKWRLIMAVVRAIPERVFKKLSI